MTTEERKLSKEIKEIQAQIKVLEELLKAKETRLTMLQQEEMIQRRNEGDY